MTDTEHTDGGHSTADGSNGHNGYDGDQIRLFLEALDSEQDELDRLKSEYMLKCKPVRARIRETMKSVKESGLDMSAFRVVLLKHEQERKLAKKADELEDDSRSAFEMMNEALGDYGSTPLGQAALDRAKKKDEGLTDLARG